MATVAEMLFAAVILVGVVTVGIAIHTTRRWDAPEAVTYAGFAAVTGAAAIAVGLVGVAGFALGTTTSLHISAVFVAGFFVWGASAVPWFVFALQYSGRSRRPGRRRVLLLSIPLLVVFVSFAVTSTGQLVFFTSLILTLTVILYLGLILSGGVLVARTVTQYGYLSWGGAVAIMSPGIIGFVMMNSLNITGQLGDLPLSGVLLLGGCSLNTIFVAVTVFRFRLFDSTPAVGTLGERTVIEQTSDLVFIFDGGEIIKCNDTALETLGRDSQSLRTESASAVFGHQLSELTDESAIDIETVDGIREYDIEVVTITDQHDHELGHVVTLHDVTERTLREQRLSVLNRVLRHNLRNELDIIKGNVEYLEEQTEADAVDVIDSRADRLASLGRTARTIDQFVSESDHRVTVDICEIIESVLENIEEKATGVEITTSSPPEATLTTNDMAVRAAIESAITNALTHADSTVAIEVMPTDDGCALSVSDNGPGIPERELELLESGTETNLRHGSGLGLWQLKWAVLTFGGELTFDVTDGTTVTFTIPDQRELNTAPTESGSGQAGS